MTWCLSQAAVSTMVTRFVEVIAWAKQMNDTQAFIEYKQRLAELAKINPRLAEDFFAVIAEAERRINQELAKLSNA